MSAITVNGGPPPGAGVAVHGSAWAPYLQAAEIPVRLAPDRTRAESPDPVEGRQHLRAGSELRASLRLLVANERCTAEAVWLAAIAAFVHRLTQQTELLIASPAERSPVPCVALHPVHVESSWSFRELVGDVVRIGAETAPIGPLPLADAVLAGQGTDARGPAMFHAGLACNSRPAAELLMHVDLVLDCHGDDVAFVYDAGRFETATVARLSEQFELLLWHALASPDTAASELRILSAEERRRMLVDWNDTAADFALDRCLPTIVAELTRTTSEVTAIVDGDEAWTYARLDAAANRLAHHLCSLGVRRGDLVGLHLERCAEAVVAHLAIMRTGAAVVLLDTAQPPQRLAFMLADACVAAVVTRHGLLDQLPPGEQTVCMDADAAEIAARPDHDPQVPVAPEDCAYVYYTSGSTGEPKGVIAPHRALTQTVRAMGLALGITGGERVSWLSAPGYGVVITEILPYLAAGACICVAKPEDVASPDGIRDWLLRTHVTDAVVVAPLAEPLLLLDWPPASGFRRMIVFGDRLRQRPPESLPFEVIGLYGSAEATSVACTRAARRREHVEPPHRGTAAGTPLPNVRIYVLDEHLAPVPAGVTGMLYVAGPGVCAGYLERPQLTRAKFVDNPLPEEPDAVIYRTGDLAVYHADGLLEIVGRSDSQVKIRGFRVEPGEIEAVLRRQPGVTQVVVVAREDIPNDRRLVAYVVADKARPCSVAELRDAVRAKLPTYMIPAAFVLLDELPCTARGKLDRQGLPAPPKTRPELAAAHVSPRGPIETSLGDIWSRLLGVDGIGVNDSFFELGGHSLLAMRMISAVRDSMGVDAQLPEFQHAPTIAGLAGQVAASLLEHARAGPGSCAPTAIRPDRDGRHEPFPLTDVQHAFWIGRGDAVELGGVGCHGYFEWEVPRLDVTRLQAAWQRLIDRHDMLRAVFRPDGRQQVLASVPPYEVAALDLRGSTAGDAESRLQHVRETMSHAVFPADRWPLFDVRVSLRDGGRARVHIGIDLLVMDAWSYMHVLMPELVRLYADPATELEPLEITFRDCVLAAADDLQGSERYEKAREYWMDKLADLPPSPDLPMATPRDALSHAVFVRRAHALDRAEWGRLQARGYERGIIPSAILATAYAEVLGRWSASDRFTINLPIFDRDPVHPQVAAVVGDFTKVGLLAMEKTDGTFSERAIVTQEQLFLTLQHRHFNGVQVLRELARMHGGGVRAAMPIVFTCMLGQSLTRSYPAFGDEVYTITQTPQVLIDHQVLEIDGGLYFNWDAQAARFPAGMVDDMFDAYCMLLQRLLDEDSSWSETTFELVAPAALEQRAAINATSAPVPDVLLHDLLIEQATRRPAAPAVIAATRRLSFDELLRASNRVGRGLRDLGARSNGLVAVVTEKGWQEYVAVFGTLISGAAYLPIDAAVPSERLAYLLDDGEVDVVLTQADLLERIQWPGGVRVLAIDRDFDDVEDGPVESLGRQTDLAMVIYTSGSTGRPKGVMLDHRAVVNTVMDANRLFAAGPSDRALAISSLSFDLSLYDAFGVLGAGGAVVVPQPFAEPRPEEWAGLMRDHRVTLLNAVPALTEILVGELESRQRGEPCSLRVAVMSGDWIPVSLPDRLRALGGDIRVISGGGPTETVIWSVAYPIGTVDPEWGSIPYGKPLSNRRCYVLDQRLQHRPTWVPGEIYVASDVGLAQGYWRDEATTRSRFVDLPDSKGRSFATGDIGRFLPDGNLEILGRSDFQVKILGHRIELGEVEAALSEHPAVRCAALVAPAAHDGRRRLAAFVVLEPDAPDMDALGEFLVHKLPAYMVPCSISPLPALPRTHNGKVDRLALSRLTGAGGQDVLAFTQPGTALARVMAAVWSELLGVPRVGMHDDFFRLGGDSLSGTRLVSRIHELLEVKLDLRALFNAPTVAGVCAALTKDPERGPRAQAAAEALVEVSSDEVAVLLSDTRQE